MKDEKKRENGKMGIMHHNSANLVADTGVPTEGTTVALAAIAERQVAIERKLDTLLELLPNRRPARNGTVRSRWPRSWGRSPTP